MIRRPPALAMLALAVALATGTASAQGTDNRSLEPVSYTHLTLPTTPYV